RFFCSLCFLGLLDFVGSCFFGISFFRCRSFSFISLFICCFSFLSFLGFSLLFLFSSQGFLLCFFTSSFFSFFLKLLLEFLFLGFEQRLLTFFACGNILFLLFPVLTPFRQCLFNFFFRLILAVEVHFVHDALLLNNTSYCV